MNKEIKEGLIPFSVENYQQVYDIAFQTRPIEDLIEKESLKIEEKKDATETETDLVEGPNKQPEEKEDKS